MANRLWYINSRELASCCHFDLNALRELIAIMYFCAQSFILIAVLYSACVPEVSSYEVNRAIAANEAEGARLAQEIQRLLADPGIPDSDKVNVRVAVQIYCKILFFNLFLRLNCNDSLFLYT